MTNRRPLVLAGGVASELPISDRLPIDALDLPAGYIEGLQPFWSSPTSVGVRAGAAYIQGDGKIVSAAGDMALTGLALPASSWSHLYSYNNAGALALEASATAPAAAYSGTARSKTGDASRRYVGSVLTDSSGNVFNFTYADNLIQYESNVFGAPFRILANGIATTPTTIDLSGLIPITAQLALLSITNSDTSKYVAIGNSSQGYTLASNAFNTFVNPNSSMQGYACVSSSFSIDYMFSGAPTGNCNIRVLGYKLGR